MLQSFLGLQYKRDKVWFIGRRLGVRSCCRKLQVVHVEQTVAKDVVCMQ